MRTRLRLWTVDVRWQEGAINKQHVWQVKAVESHTAVYRVIRDGFPRPYLVRVSGPADAPEGR